MEQASKVVSRRKRTQNDGGLGLPYLDPALVVKRDASIETGNSEFPRRSVSAKGLLSDAKGQELEMELLDTSKTPVYAGI